MLLDLRTLTALLAFGAVALLPGLVLCAPLLRGERDPLVRAGLAAGAGLALWPVLALWLDTFGLPFEWPAIVTVLVASAAILALRFARRRPAHRRAMRVTEHARSRANANGTPTLAALHPSPRAEALEQAEQALQDDPAPTWRHPATLATLGLLLALLAARAWAARGVTVPLWGDSVHHAMIVALFDHQRGLPNDWLPYVPLATFSYHFGLHAVTRTVAVLSGLAPERALVVTGQGLMVLQALTAYALVAGLTGRRWAGFGAALAAAGLGSMPGFYLNWGRYTQLAGQVVLPAAALATVRLAGRAGLQVVGSVRGSEGGRAGASRDETASGRGGTRGGGVEADGADEAGRADTRATDEDRSANRTWTSHLSANAPLLVAALLVGGLALTHYLVTIFFVLFIVAWLAVGAWGGDHEDPAGRAVNADRPGRIAPGDRAGRTDRADALAEASSNAARPSATAVALRRAIAARLAPLPRLLAIAGVAFLVVLPWLPRVLAGRLDNHAAALLTSELPDASVWGLPPPSYVWTNLSAFVGWPLVAFAGVGLAWAIWSTWAARSTLNSRAASGTGRAWAGWSWSWPTWSSWRTRSSSQGEQAASAQAPEPSEGRRQPVAPRTARPHHLHPSRQVLARAVPLRRAAGLGALWALLLLASAYPAVVGLPITGPIKDFTVFIGLYLPLGLLVGAATAAWADAVPRGLATVLGPDVGRGKTLVLAAALFMAAVVPWRDRDVIEAQHVLVTPADERAIAWITQNTPADAGFLVSAGPAYGDTVVAGEDGGWWLPLLAERRTTLPPITYGLEPSIEPGWREQVNALNEAWRTDLDGGGVPEILRGAGFGWAYVGPTARTLRTDALDASPNWTRVYADGGAAVYRADWAGSGE